MKKKWRSLVRVEKINETTMEVVVPGSMTYPKLITVNLSDLPFNIYDVPVSFKKRRIYAKTFLDFESPKDMEFEDWSIE